MRGVGARGEGRRLMVRLAHHERGVGAHHERRRGAGGALPPLPLLPISPILTFPHQGGRDLNSPLSLWERARVRGVGARGEGRRLMVRLAHHERGVGAHHERRRGAGGALPPPTPPPDLPHPNLPPSRGKGLVQQPGLAAYALVETVACRVTIGGAKTDPPTQRGSPPRPARSPRIV